MSKQRLLAGITAIAMVTGLTVVSLTGTAAANLTPQYTRLAGTVAPFTGTSQKIGPVSGTTRLSIEVWLKPNLAAAERYAKATSTPGGPLFHHFLSPDAYTARFGASKAAAASVEAWLRSQGFSAVQADSQRDYVRATGPVSIIDAAFKVALDTYRNSAQATGGRYALMANSNPVTMPAALASVVTGVTGLDNAAVQQPIEFQNALPDSPAARKAAAEAAHPPRSAPCSVFYGQHYAKELPKKYGLSSFPTQLCGYSAGQLRSAYGASLQATGKGQTIALIELGLTSDMYLTLRAYARRNGLPLPGRGQYHQHSIGKRNACGDQFDIEEQLDVEASYAMAPGVNQLVIGGNGCNTGDAGLQGLFNADLYVINGQGNHPLATIVSNSWEGADEEQPPTETTIETNFLVKAAAEGVGMYFSAGDGSGVLSPSDNPWSIAVGGTTLAIGRHSARLFETGWSTGESILTTKHGWVFAGEQGATGGGPSLLWAQPGYQSGVVPVQFSEGQGNRVDLVRSAPDISADADPFTGMKIVYIFWPQNKKKKPYFKTEDVGGTSESSPLVAGMVAAAQQGQPHSFGFVDPALYQLAGTPALRLPLPITSSSPAEYQGVACDAFVCQVQTLTRFDDQNPKMSGYFGQVTVPGYNDMTGLGTPNGQVFIAALRGLEG